MRVVCLLAVSDVKEESQLGVKVYERDRRGMVIMTK